MTSGQSRNLVPEWLTQRARLSPARLALQAPASDDPNNYVFLNFEQLARRVELAARRLAAAGIKKDTRVSLLLSNSLAYVELIHALPRLGAILVPVSTRLSAEEAHWQIADSDSSVLICDDSTAALAAEIGRRSSRIMLLSVSSNVEPRTLGRVNDLPVTNVALAERIDLDATHSILYTSGTTGRPKGAILTYGNHWWSAISSLLNLGLTSEDRWLACLPLYHIGGLAIVL